MNNSDKSKRLDQIDIQLETEAMGHQLCRQDEAISFSWDYLKLSWRALFRIIIHGAVLRAGSASQRALAQDTIMRIS